MPDDGSSEAPVPRAIAEPQRRLGLVAAVLFVMVVVVVVGLLASVQSVHELSSAQRQQAAQAQTDRFACLEGAMRAGIPSGALVFNEGADGLHLQRIAEELTPGYAFVAAPVPGSYRVKFTSPGPCFGLGVNATKVASR